MRLFRLFPYLPKIGSELLLAAGINGAFFILAALLLWPFGQVALVGHLAMGWLLYVVVGGLALLLSVVLHSLFRIEIDPPSDACMLLNLAVGAVVQLGWAAFAALAVVALTPGAASPTTIALYFVGLLASWLSTVVTGAYFQGSVYKSANALAAIVGYAVFAFWPGAARALYGWFFAWF